MRRSFSLTVRSCCSYCLLVCSRSGMDIGANINQNKDIFQNCYCPVKVSGSLVAVDGETVADSMDGLNVDGLLGLVLDFFPHTADVDVDAARRDGAVVAPDAVEQLIA